VGIVGLVDSIFPVRTIAQLQQHDRGRVGKPEEPYIRRRGNLQREWLGATRRYPRSTNRRPRQGLRVRFPKSLRRAYPIGTLFRVYAKLTDREGGGEFVHTNHAWDVEVLVPPNE
jgi:hypothetical protein